MARVNEGSNSFTCHTTRLSTSGMSHTCLNFPATECHHASAGTHFPEAELAWVAWSNTEVVCLRENGHLSQY